MSVVQISGFAILLDRRHSSWQELTAAFYKIVSQFPGHIKEVFLLYKYPAGNRFNFPFPDPISKGFAEKHSNLSGENRKLNALSKYPTIVYIDVSNIEN